MWITPRLNRFFLDYEAFHATHGNKICHYFGIPMILVTLLGLLSRLKFGLIDAGFALVLASSVFYIWLSWRIAIPYLILVLGCYVWGIFLPMPILWVVFVLGWVLQGIGHYKYEKRSPAFFKNLTHILVGPLWIFADFTGLRRKMS